jgi:hypothetical protein
MTVLYPPNDDINTERAECPICDATFWKGWYHTADMKLYDHMGRGKAHRSLRNDIWWNW